MRPAPPRAVSAQGLISSPAPGSYDPIKPELRSGAGVFGTGGRTPRIHATERSAVGPGSYEIAPRLKPKAPLFVRNERFEDMSKRLTPGPGQYNNARPFSETQGNPITSRTSRLAITKVDERALGPGSYSFHENAEAQRTAKFGTSPRFRTPGQTTTMPLHVLVQDMHKKHRTRAKTDRTSYISFVAERREKKLADMLASSEGKAVEHNVDPEEMLDADERRARELDMQKKSRAQEEAANLRARWLALLHVVIRAGHMGQLLQEKRDKQKASEEESQQAAALIQRNAADWYRKLRAQREQKAAMIVLRVLRRFVFRRRYWRRRRSAEMILVLLRRAWNQKQAVYKILEFKAKVRSVQRLWRRVLELRTANMGLLQLQWQAEEQRVINGVRADIIQSGKLKKPPPKVPAIPPVPADIRNRLLREDYTSRRRKLYQALVAFRQGQGQQTPQKASTQPLEKKETGDYTWGTTFHHLLPLPALYALLWAGFYVNPDLSSTADLRVRAREWMKKELVKRKLPVPALLEAPTNSSKTTTKKK